MAWFRVHQELFRHPKLKRLARGLGVSEPAAIGHLLMLWGWALDFAPDGDLQNFDNEDIAEAMNWKGSAAELVDALVLCGGRGQSGFLDRAEDGRLTLHNWDENCGADYERRQKDAKRKKEKRASEKLAAQNADKHGTHSGSAGCPLDVRRMSAVRGEERKGKEIPPPPPPGVGGVGAGGESPRAELPSKAGQPETSPTAEKSPAPNEAHKSGGARSTGGHAEKSQTPQAQKSGGDGQTTDGKEAEYPAAFSTFWAAYPRKVQKQTALKAWRALVKHGASDADVLNAAAAYQAATLRRGTPPDKIMHPATFLREARWRDWLPPDGASYREAMEARRESPRTAVLQAPMTYADAVERFRGAGAATVDLSPGEWREAPERGPAMEGTK